MGGFEDDVRGFFAGRIPEGWFTEAPEVRMDEVEVLVVGTLPEPETGEGQGEAVRATALESRIEAWREETRARRIRIAQEAERRFRRKVSWGARCGEVERLFTVAAVPFMTRLRMPERAVLDTLVEAGVARSRSHALAWCVRMVGENQAEWIGKLREALEGVQQVRREGPIQTV
ncbi:MAG: hypothetical protein HY658_05670 [Actinobacteria bacterium]|nr:hypothetical protein [Actinomycetota bacterium]